MLFHSVEMKTAKLEDHNKEKILEDSYQNFED